MVEGVGALTVMVQRVGCLWEYSIWALSRSVHDIRHDHDYLEVMLTPRKCILIRRASVIGNLDAAAALDGVMVQI